MPNTGATPEEWEQLEKQLAAFLPTVHGRRYDRWNAYAS
jgi:hypothetical protein